MTHAPLTVAAARAAVLEAVTPGPPLRLPLPEALGGILTSAVHAPVALPPWTNAAMDGYAVRAADVRGASAATPVRLPVSGRVAAGDPPPPALAPGRAVRCFTGAPLPAGTDSVIRQEDTDRGDAVVTITADRDAGQHVRPAGADLARGAPALAAGTRIGPGQLALLAALGVSHPEVHRRPRIAILTSGDELVPYDATDAIHAGTKLADVNGPALAALVAAVGGVAVPLGIAADTPEAIAARLDAAADADLLLTAGGVSVGDHDRIHDVMAARGVALRFRRVRLRPGGPTAFGVLSDGRPWLGLPGNPVSAMVTFTLFAAPAIRRMAGDPAPAPVTLPVTVATPIARDPHLDLYLRVRLAPGDPHPTATPTGPQGSGILTSMARADALLEVPAGTTPLVGAARAIPLRDGAFY